ncbi:FAD-binding oxidoreductase [Streptomyces sp. SHP 1-2]|uniref:FAD-binding oxidoreductase n=1 Tax=Streptomyces sp. SHP 1-2 TaxID=2769489 RepID=UPI002237609B|nr:FAD-binding protein [Streptomyces sp. SHP 1-2]MCW5253293.1 FAD-binding protein [Streptomyces sp. SHP 1-2]
MSRTGKQPTRRSLLAAAGGVAGVTALGHAQPALAAPGGAAGATAAADPVVAAAVVPGDPRYGDLRAGLNQRWTSSPDRIHLVSTTEQVVRIVAEAAASRRRVTVRSGGHCYEEFVYNADVEVVVDMSEMNAVYFDPDRNAFAVEPGATLGDVYDRLFRGWGVTVPGGMCYSVGAGGHVAGGGWGLLCRRDGLIVDHLYAVEVVTVDAAGNARAVVATRDDTGPLHDLWWAHTGGGGGTFGIVTRYWFRSPGAAGTDPSALLPKPPAEVLVSALSWPWAKLTKADFTTLVRNFGTWHEAQSAPGGTTAGLVTLLNLNHVSAGEIGLLTQVTGDTPNAEAVLQDCLDHITRGVRIAPTRPSENSSEHGPLANFFVPRRWSWLKATHYLGTSNQVMTNPLLRGDQKSAYHRRGFTAAQISTLYQHLRSTQLDNPMAQVVVSSYGAQVNALAPGDTAQVHRDSAFKVLYQANWTETEDDAANLAWLRGLYRETYADKGGVPAPDRQTSGCFVNYCDIDLSDAQYNSSPVPWHDLYWGGNYPRLQRTKAHWDPTDFFRHGQSVRLP